MEIVPPDDEYCPDEPIVPRRPVRKAPPAPAGPNILSKVEEGDPLATTEELPSPRQRAKARFRVLPGGRESD